MYPKFLILMAATAVTSPLALSCSCIAPPPPKEALIQSHAVFAGKVESITEVNSWNKVVFRVTESWKGKGNATMTVYTHTQPSACGFLFKIGTGYIVYAYHEQPSASEPVVLMTNICTRTALDSETLSDRKAFGPGSKPTSE